MKKIILILFLGFYSFLFSQQTFEICEQGETYTYFSDFEGDGVNTWYINGVSYNGDFLTYTFVNPGIYNIVMRRDNILCYVEQSYQVTVTECEGILYWVPNTFTPDDNEVNQVFGPVMSEGYDLNDFEFLIFNRWGETVWESHDPFGVWDGTYDGKKCTDGVYVWKLQFNVNGNDGRIQDQGHLTLLR